MVWMPSKLPTLSSKQEKRSRELSMNLQRRSGIALCFLNCRHSVDIC